MTDELDYTAYGPEPEELNANTLYTAAEQKAAEEALLNEYRG